MKFPSVQGYLRLSMVDNKQADFFLRVKLSSDGKIHCLPLTFHQAMNPEEHIPIELYSDGFLHELIYVLVIQKELIKENVNAD